MLKTNRKYAFIQSQVRSERGLYSILSIPPPTRTDGRLDHGEQSRTETETDQIYDQYRMEGDIVMNRLRVTYNSISMRVV